MDYIENWVKTHERTQGISFDFFLTQFIYPLKHPIVLSEKLGLTLDNLRTAEEVDFFSSVLVAVSERSSETKTVLPDFQNPNLFFRHYDTDHPHLHLLVNRITFDGKVVSDSNNYKMSEAIPSF